MVLLKEQETDQEVTVAVWDATAEHLDTSLSSGYTELDILTPHLLTL